MRQQQMQQPMRLQPGATVNTGWQAYSGETVLAINDMQPDFKESTDPRLIAKVCGLIAHARAHNWVIVLIEFVGHGDTLPQIRKALEGYHRLIEAKKHCTNDGSGAVLAKLREHHLKAIRFVGCGVSINACVRETMAGLAFSQGHPMTDVVMSACGDHYAPRWDEYPDASHLRLLPELQ